MTAYERINEAMIQNEREVITHLENRRVSSTMLFGRAWAKAFDRLCEAGIVKYNRKKVVYEVAKFARPVTKQVR